MKIRRLLLLVPLITLSVLAALYFAVDYWLESAGGRRALERTLSEQVGMPVHLNGDFNIKLLPSVGVSGTELVVSDPLTGEDLAVGGYFETDLALAPLFREELEVRHVLVERLKLALPDGGNVFIPRVRLESFGFGRPTDFEVDWSWLGVLSGQFTWSPNESRVLLDALWVADDRDDVSYRGTVDYGPELVRFGSSELAVGAQTISGEGCLQLAGAPVLNLMLEAETLDLDALSRNIPGGEGASGSLPFELNLRLDAAEIRRDDVTAFDTRLEIGSEPACP